MEELVKQTSSLGLPEAHFHRSINKTLGVDFLQTEKFLKDHGVEVKFYIWDTAGQEEYDALTKRYYKGASA
jgi:Ras-related protein Rab-23